MGHVWTMGELLVEVMRPEPGIGLGSTGQFVGPFPSGAPGIFIDTVARLGHDAHIISAVGDDEFGGCILRRLEHDGVHTELVERIRGKSTGVAFVSYDRDGSRSFIFHWEGTPAVMAPVPDPEAIRPAEVFHVMGCSLMANADFRERVFQTVKLFSEVGARITFDPNVRSELLRDEGVERLIGPVLDSCDVLLPGEDELKLIAARNTVESSLAEVFSRFKVRVVVLKQGSRGCTVCTREGSTRVDSFRVDEVDPTGAGDCFDAAFVCGQLDGLSDEAAARQAAAVGAMNAEAFGPMEGDLSADRVRRMLQQGG